MPERVSGAPFSAKIRFQTGCFQKGIQPSFEREDSLSILGGKDRLVVIRFWPDLVDKQVP